MLKLKLQYFGPLMRRADSFEKTLMLGGIEGRRRRGQQDEMARRHHRLDGHESEQIPKANLLHIDLTKDLCSREDLRNSRLKWGEGEKHVTV